MLPNKLIPATEKVNSIRVSREAVFRILPKDMYRVLRRDLNP
jgi:hypothetical protein